MGLERMKPLLKIMSDYYHCTTETPSAEVFKILIELGCPKIKLWVEIGQRKYIF